MFRNDKQFLSHTWQLSCYYYTTRTSYYMDTEINTKNIKITIILISQVLRIHGVHSERRVLAQVIKDSSNCFGCGDVTLSIPVAFPIPMCYVKKSGSCEYCIICKWETIKRGMRFLKFHRMICLERKYVYKSDPSVFNEEFGVIWIKMTDFSIV